MGAFIVYEMCYPQRAVESPGIDCIPFERKYLKEYKRLYNACFYEMRKALGIEPTNVYTDKDRLEEKRNGIFLLLGSGGITGSVACRGNVIDDLFVEKAHQRRGYGKQLLLWGIQRIRQENKQPVTLHVAAWNERAVALYEQAGFAITKKEMIKT